MIDGTDPVNAVTAQDGEGLQGELRPDLEIIRPLGRGSTTDVYLARERPLQRLVAVKVLRPELWPDEEVRQRFVRGAEEAAHLTHPHVTAVHRVGYLSNGVPYVVMEYVEGRTIADLVGERGAFAPAEARQVLASVAAALATAHDRGVVHRDVRPANVYVENRTGRAVLTDFCSASLLSSGVETATRLAAGYRPGETRYVSPEQLRGEPITAESDVYCFGLLAYEVLTGGGPYDAKTDAQLMIAHMTAEPRPLGALLPDSSVRWGPLLERGLAKNPGRRPGAGELAAALAAPPATAPAIASPSFDAIRRSRVVTWLAVIGLVFLGLVAFLLLSSG
jgi:serine/threonine protein kinase